MARRYEINVLIRVIEDQVDPLCLGHLVKGPFTRCGIIFTHREYPSTEGRCALYMRNLLERALWTGVQSALAILSLEALSSLDASAVEVLIASGIAAVLSALKTLAVERLAVLAPIKPE